MDLSSLSQEQQATIEEVIIMIAEATTFSDDQKVQYFTDFSTALAKGEGSEFIRSLQAKLREQELPALKKERDRLLQEQKEDEQELQQELTTLQALPDETKKEAQRLLDEAYKKAEASKNQQESSQINALRKFIQNKD